MARATPKFSIHISFVLLIETTSWKRYIFPRGLTNRSHCVTNVTCECSEKVIWHRNRWSPLGHDHLSLQYLHQYECVTGAWPIYSELLMQVNCSAPRKGVPVCAVVCAGPKIASNTAASVTYSHNLCIDLPSTLLFLSTLILNLVYGCCSNVEQ